MPTSPASRYVLLTATSTERSPVSAPKRRFRLARLQLNPTGPPPPGSTHLRRAYD